MARWSNAVPRRQPLSRGGSATGCRRGLSRRSLIGRVSCNEGSGPLEAPLTKLVLLEPNTINLLAQAGYDTAFAEPWANGQP